MSLKPLRPSDALKASALFNSENTGYKENRHRRQKWLCYQAIRWNHDKWLELVFFPILIHGPVVPISYPNITRKIYFYYTGQDLQHVKTLLIFFLCTLRDLCAYSYPQRFQNEPFAALWFLLIIHNSFVFLKYLW